jgi:hypothetical protein
MNKLDENDLAHSDLSWLPLIIDFARPLVRPLVRPLLRLLLFVTIN